LGIVAIGRNEGDRWRRCLESVIHTAAKVVYVDSNSTDKSVEMALAMSIDDVVRLDMHDSFTAARARNAGFRRLRELVPNLTYAHLFCRVSRRACRW
jgi:glycosyltransferase involved in cell wall biosynthesis